MNVELIKKSMASMCDILKTPNEIQDIIDFLGLLKTSMAEVLEHKMSLDATIKEYMQVENSIKCNECMREVPENEICVVRNKICRECYYSSLEEAKHPEAEHIKAAKTCRYKMSVDNINSPNHYTQGGVECIDAINAAVINKTGLEAVCVANVIKYLWRYELKNGLEDIKKAQWYLEKLISLKEEK